MRGDIKTKQCGFTLIELLIAMALGLVVMAVIFRTFKSQNDSYSVQSQVSMAQQNLRAALYVITRDIRMAGFYTSFVDSEYSSDWDNNPATDEVAIKPLIYMVNDVKGVSGVKNGTDILIVIKASDKHRKLVSGERATAGNPFNAGIFLTDWEKNSITKPPRDLDGDGKENELTYYSGAGHSKYGLLVKRDLTRAEVFEVDSSNNFVFKSGLVDDYDEGDSIYKLDVIMYIIDNSIPEHPALSRINIGTDNSFREIAENVDNLQFEFVLDDGSTVTNLDEPRNIPLVRAVKVFIFTRSENEIRKYSGRKSYPIGSIGVYKPDDRFLRRLLSSTIKTRNIGH